MSRTILVEHSLLSTTHRSGSTCLDCPIASRFGEGERDVSDCLLFLLSPSSSVSFNRRDCLTMGTIRSCYFADDVNCRNVCRASTEFRPLHTCIRASCWAVRSWLRCVEPKRRRCGCLRFGSSCVVDGTCARTLRHLSATRLGESRDFNVQLLCYNYWSVGKRRHSCTPACGKLIPFQVHAVWGLWERKTKRKIANEEKQGMESLNNK